MSNSARIETNVVLFPFGYDLQPLVAASASSDWVNLDPKLEELFGKDFLKELALSNRYIQDHGAKTELRSNFPQDKIVSLIEGIPDTAQVIFSTHDLSLFLGCEIDTLVIEEDDRFIDRMNEDVLLPKDDFIDEELRGINQRRRCIRTHDVAEIDPGDTPITIAIHHNLAG